MTARLEVSLRHQVGTFTLDVAFSSGEPLVVLFGPSAAGKTMTLHCLAGLLAPTAGRVVVDGRVLLDRDEEVDLPPQARHVGYVFQHGALFPHLTVAENVTFGLRHLSRPERQRRGAEALERLGITDLADRRPRDLSGGQRQRVALGRALAPEPRFLLLDEPLAALDAPGRRQLLGELRGFLREQGIPAVLVTHDLGEACQLGEQIVVYDTGRVVQVAPPGELLWRPASAQVARIIGLRNVLQGTVAAASPERIDIAWRGQVLEAANSPRRGYVPDVGAPIAFCVGPEHVRLRRKDRPAPSGDHHLPNRLEGEVIADIDQGARVILQVRLSAPGEPAQGDHDLEIELTRLVYELLDLEHDRRWEMSIHRGAIQVLPG